MRYRVKVASQGGVMSGTYFEEKVYVCAKREKVKWHQLMNLGEGYLGILKKKKKFFFFTLTLF